MLRSRMALKVHKNMVKFLEFCQILPFFKMPVFRIFRSKVHTLRWFLTILRRRAYARLQLLEAL